MLATRISGWRPASSAFEPVTFVPGKGAIYLPEPAKNSNRQLVPNLLETREQRNQGLTTALFVSGSTFR
jgi:hypothetical protein